MDTVLKDTGGETGLKAGNGSAGRDGVGVESRKEQAGWR